MEEKIKTNSLKAWVLASRPKTLSGAVSPVLIGGALTYHDLHSINLVPFVLCLFFALIMQIDANLINDYFDFKKGSDREDRLGPLRACAQGWITEKCMKIGITITSIIGCLLGLPLVMYGGWWLIGVGVFCLIFCFLYTTCMSYIGMGDILVVLFFGIIPIGFTYYIQTGQWTTLVTLYAIAQGLVTDCLLMVNNYRDRNQDALSNKKTIVVRFGAKVGLNLYLWLGIWATCLVVSTSLTCLTYLIYIFLHANTYKQMEQLDGKELNNILKDTSRNILVFAIISVIVLMIK